MIAVAAGAACYDSNEFTISAPLMLDGRGGVHRNVVITVSNGTIRAIKSGPLVDGAAASIAITDGTVLPGLIDTHVHISSHFAPNGRADYATETAAEFQRAIEENAQKTLMAGFTTVQSVGDPTDVLLRDAISRGDVVGPRILTSVSALKYPDMSVVAIRAWVHDMVGAGADVIKIFASASIRDGGGQTLTDAQIAAACGEARALGKRSWVHAHSASAIQAAVLAGCTTVAHGSQATEAEFALMATHGVYFEPNIGLVSQVYVENRERYIGTSNFTDDTFRWYADSAIPAKVAMFREALRQPGLLLICGTDAPAGGHGANAREIISRVEEGGQTPMDAIIGATSLAAEALGLDRKVGSLAPGMAADLIAVDGDPISDITALSRVQLVVRDGRIYKERLSHHRAGRVRRLYRASLNRIRAITTPNGKGK